MQYISLFAGIGGFDLALNRLGHECVWANEWDKYAAQIYDKNFSDYSNHWEQKEKGKLSSKRGNNISNYSKSSFNGFEPISILCDRRDIRTIPTNEIPNHELLVAGFPCQSFSIAGKRGGFDDTRGTLFFEIARILKDKKPRYFLLENVKGLLSHNNGNTFKTIITTLDELGYDLQWQVLNSKNFGVPQNRERVFIVGHIRGTSRPEIFPIRESTSRSNERIYETPIVGALQGGGHSGGHHSSMTLIHNVYGGFNETKFREFKEYSPTIRTPKGGGHLPMVLNGMKIRRLTPLECERLQGFPDGWTEGISDTQRYKCLGNAVTVNVVYEIVRRLECNGQMPQKLLQV